MSVRLGRECSIMRLKRRGSTRRAASHWIGGLLSAEILAGAPIGSQAKYGDKYSAMFHIALRIAFALFQNQVETSEPSERIVKECLVYLKQFKSKAA